MGSRFGRRLDGSHFGRWLDESHFRQGAGWKPLEKVTGRRTLQVGGWLEATSGGDSMEITFGMWLVGSHFGR